MKILHTLLILLLGTKLLFADVTTEELLSKLNNNNITVLDTRSEDSYNGWILHNEERNGHIKNAKPFPAMWTTLLKKDSAIIQELKEKKEVILYGANKKETQTVFNFLKNSGLNNVTIYESGINKYAKNPTLPMEKLARFEKLVPASYIKSLLDNNVNFKLFEVSWGKGKEYKKAHIPTAVHINTDDVENGPIWNYKDKKELHQFVLNNGITKTSQVILYGADTMAASRVAIALMAMGVQDVRLLNGGFKAWLDKGYKTQKGNNKSQSVKSFGTEFFTNSQLIKNTNDAQNILKQNNASLISVRSENEFIGKTSGYSYIKPRGHIKGAIWGNSGSDAYHLENYRSVSNKMLNEADIKRFWKKLKIDTKKHLSFYCGTGWRATEVLFYAYVMGLDHTSLYDGGWLEWSLDKSRAVVNESEQ